MPRYSLGTSRIGANATSEKQRLVWLRELGGLLLRGPRLLTPLLFALAVSLTAGTSASFTDDMAFPTQEVGAGSWIPTLSILVDGERGEDGKEYATPPCIRFESDLDDVHIYYSLSGEDLLESGTHYTDGCIEMSEDKETFAVRALAVHDENTDWQSEEEQYTFVLTPKEDEQPKKEKKDDDKEDAEEDEQVVELVSESEVVIMEEVSPTTPMTPIEEEELIIDAVEVPIEEAWPIEEGLTLETEEESLETSVIEEVEEEIII